MRHYSTAKYYKPKFKFLLGLYTAIQVLLLPLLAASIILFKLWWVPLAVFGFRAIIQGIVLYKSMKRTSGHSSSCSTSGCSSTTCCLCRRCGSSRRRPGARWLIGSLGNWFIGMGMGIWNFSIWDFSIWDFNHLPAN
jgi:hypothetical protein